MGTLRSEPVSTTLQRIAELARRHPGKVLTTLAHHIDEGFLREAYERTRKDGAPGVDGQTAVEYAANLEENLRSLLDRLKTGTYRAPPVRRVYIPKGDGSKVRPIGIPTFEDKVLQRAVTMVMEAVYEQDFSNSSFGFRPRRSAHDALQTLWEGMTELWGGFVLDVDIQDFYGSLDHGHLNGFLDQRVRDGVLRRVIGKWLNAGVLEEGRQSHPETGTPQGGVISPLLANIYLHETLDRWFEQEVQPRMVGRTQLVRYADDFVIVCAEEHDARRVMEVLPKRLGRFGLTVHPEKSRRVDFRPPRANGPKPGTFDFLGFTHFWGRSRQGRPVVKRKTAADRFRRTVKRIGEWLRHHFHQPVREQHGWLTGQMKGHNGYYGVTGNMPAIKRLRDVIERVWHRWLNRRSNSHWLRWDRFALILERYPLPKARLPRSVYPTQRILL